MSDDIRALAPFTDVFDGFLRHLAGILDEVLPAAEFWALVGDCVRQHAADHPELAGSWTCSGRRSRTRA